MFGDSIDYGVRHRRRVNRYNPQFPMGGEVGVVFEGIIDVYDEPLDRDGFAEWAREMWAEEAVRAEGTKLKSEWRHELLLLEVDDD
jgi:hypothetical protein